MRKHFCVITLLLFVGTGGAGTEAAHAAGDTFACLNSFNGPVTKRTGDQGTKTLRIGSDFPDQSRYDLRGSVFNQDACKGSGCKINNPYGPHPIEIGGGWQAPPTSSGACIAGATVVGRHDEGETWNEIKDTSGGGIQVRGQGTIIDGNRLDNVGEDAIRPNAHDGIVRNNWVSRVFDECLEGDGKWGYIAEDNLFDGCYQFQSAVVGGKNTPKGNVITIRSNLVRLATKPGYNRGHLGFFKIWDGNSPSVIMENNLLAIDHFEAHLDIFGTGVLDKIKRCSNNTLLWLGNSAYDHKRIAHLPSGCITKVVEGSEAKQIWNSAKQNWINCHPDVPRVSGDPSSNFSQCNPNVFGGGGIGAGSGNSGSATGLCNLYTSGQAAPNGYAAAWNPLTAGKELLLSAYCQANGSINYTVGNPNGPDTWYVYDTGYYFTDSWQQMTFTGTYASGSTDWLLREGTLTRSNPPAGDHYWVGYMCQWTGNEWKCGCRDSQCTTNYWQLQKVIR